MKTATKRGLRLDANYTEEVVGFALESFLTLVSFPHHRFSIEPFSRQKERWLGADARLHRNIRGFRPFYMQFKRPTAYPDYSKSKVILDRKNCGLTTDPNTLYFGLRQKDANHNDFQHNILFRLHKKLQKRQLGDAAYVCPLFLDRSAYRFNLHMSALMRLGRFWRRHPWDFDDVLLSDNGKQILFNRVPVFAEHITVPPHITVNTASHRYSFTELGTELCFHSPEALPDGSKSLVSFLEGVAAGFLDGGEKLSPEQSGEELNDIISYVLGDRRSSKSRFRLDGDDPLEDWFSWGDYLRNEYEIEQFALVRWKDGAEFF